MEMMQILLTVLLSGAGLVALAYVLGVFRYISNSQMAVVEKLWSSQGSVRQGLIALNGEAGFEAEILRGGFHFFFPLQYKVHSLPLVTISQGSIGYIFARDGRELSATQSLASNAETAQFQNVREFLQKGGQKGPQRAILREGTYAINLAQFVVITQERIFALNLDENEISIFEQMAATIESRKGFTPLVIKDTDDMLGVVTVHDGPSLETNELIAPPVGDDANLPETYHNNFQDPEKFLKAGGRRGRQLLVLVEGTYYINRLFATVEMIPKSIVEVGHVGVVTSYTGIAGKDISGSEYKHGELVEKGHRGVWSEPLLPGKYAFNTYAGKLISVPTTNFILKWNRGETGSHRFDENLAEVSLITKDAFEPSLPLSVVVHIDYKKAPLVVQRFGDIKKLVEQTLDPMVAAYFKNIGQTRTLIQLIQERSDIQKQASLEMKQKFAQYSLELLEVLIGTPSAQVQGSQGLAGKDQIEQILTQLRARQIAEEQVETYRQQEKASVKERELREAEARAKQQTALTESELSILIQSNQGKAALARAEQQASEIQTLAGAESEKIRRLAEGESKKIQLIALADAERAAKVGIAEAIAVQEKVRAYGGPRFQLTQQVMSRFAEAIQAAKVDVVPKIMIQGSGGSRPEGESGSSPNLGSNVMEGLLTLLLSEKMGLEVTELQQKLSPEAEKIKREVLG